MKSGLVVVYTLQIFSFVRLGKEIKQLRGLDDVCTSTKFKSSNL